MRGTYCYLPILRARHGAFNAVGSLSPLARSRLTPLFDFPGGVHDQVDGKLRLDPVQDIGDAEPAGKHGFVRRKFLTRPCSFSAYVRSSRGAAIPQPGRKRRRLPAAHRPACAALLIMAGPGRPRHTRAFHETCGSGTWTTWRDENPSCCCGCRSYSCCGSQNARCAGCCSRTRRGSRAENRRPARPPDGRCASGCGTTIAPHRIEPPTPKDCVAQPGRVCVPGMRHP